jgi:Tol biopolymer transport system component
MRKLGIGFTILFFFVLIQNGQAQFYNGLQMSFGKNRVQYSEPFWRYYRYQNFDVYYDIAGKGLAEYVAKNAVGIEQEVKAVLDISYSRRIIYVVYNTLGDLRQSNIGLSTSDDQYNIGGTTQIIDNKIILYFNGDHNDLKQQIRKGIALLMIREFLYGTENYREIISNSALHDYPDWFVYGIAEYISGNWSPLLEEKLVDGLQTKQYLKLTHLTNDDAVLVGSALWKYIAEVYGYKAISNIIFISRVSEDIETGFEYILGRSLHQILKDMSSYYIDKHSSGNPQEIAGNNITIPRKTRKIPISYSQVSPDLSKLLLVSNQNGKAILWYKDIVNNKSRKIYKTGQNLNQIVDYSYPIMAWHPSGESFVYFTEEEGKIWLHIYIVKSKETITREFFHFEKVLDFEFSKDGANIVFSGVKGGQVDVFTYNMQTYNYKQITNDLSDDRYPKFINNDEQILFSSNRNSAYSKSKKDSIRSTYDMFIVSKNGADKQVQRLQNTTLDNEIKPIELQNSRYLYLSDKNGIYNLYQTSNDSILSNVDTAFHYRYITKIDAVSDFNRNIISFSQPNNENKTVLQYVKNQKNYFSFNTLLQQSTKPKTLYYKEQSDSITKFNELQAIESYKNKNSYISPKQIDYNAYVFEYEINPYHYIVDSIFIQDSSISKKRIPNLYETNFYVNQIVNQVDFGFLNSSYQPFTGNAFYYMPGLNFHLKFGVIDLFEDYRLTAGIRLSSNFNTNEYVFSVENLKKRWDKQFIFHKQSILTYSEEGISGYSVYYHKLQDYNSILYLKYPLNQVQAFIISPNVRFNRDIILSTDINSLREPIKDHLWAGISFKYIFDNTVPKTLNIMQGTRLKVFGEAFTEVNNVKSYVTVLGFDVRNYLKIHKNFIFANRIGYSYAFGNAPLLYYIGSVDNWINVMGKNSTFNNAIEYDKSTDWAYQAIGTNLRGFSQNIRNGPGFAVVNSELRMPIVQYILNRPIASDVLTNLQLIGFFDAGAAWNGLYPGAKPNAYNYSIISNKPITVVIDEMRSPFVYGYGYGLRTRFFGYFVRADWAWGVDAGEIEKIFYLSLSLDF